MRLFLFGSISIALCACTTMSSKEMETRAYQILDFCLEQVVSMTGNAISAEADRAYLHVDKRYSWAIFSHGAVGTFGERSLDAKIVLSCGVLNGPPMRVVFMGVPLEYPLIDELGQEYVDSPEGAIEFLFKRKGEKFEYCCSQPFDEDNFYKHNPDFPWNPNLVGS